MFKDIIVKIIADYLVVVVVAVGGIVLLRVPRAARLQVWGKAIMTGLVALWLAKWLSIVVPQGQRPFELLGLDPGAAFLPNPGFPSDHMLLVGTVTAVVWAATKQKVLAGTLFVASVLVGIGRVFALVHSPADVLGGAFCALVAAAWIYGPQFFAARRQSDSI